jgi:hypothetical protein
MDYAKKLLKKGFASKIIIPVQEKQFVRLSIAQASTWKEAKEQMKELQAEEEEIKQRELKLKQEK